MKLNRRINAMQAWGVVEFCAGVILLVIFVVDAAVGFELGRDFYGLGWRMWVPGLGFSAFGVWMGWRLWSVGCRQALDAAGTRQQRTAIPRPNDA